MMYCSGKFPFAGMLNIDWTQHVALIELQSAEGGKVENPLSLRFFLKLTSKGLHFIKFVFHIYAYY